MPEITKLIGERFTFAVDFTPKLPDNGALVSGVLMARRVGKTESTTLTASVSPAAMTVSLADNVRAGALLIIDPGLTTEEPLLVLSVAGNGPYTATLASAVQLAHAAAAQVRYEQGATETLLASPTASISGTQMKANVVGGLVYHYVVTFLATLVSGEILREDVDVILND